MRSINETEKLLTTPLYQWHCNHNATMAAFGAYTLPLWYEGGAKAEHLAVLSRAGLFDTSHMTALVLEGEDSFALLQHFFSRDLRRWGKAGNKALPIGKGIYGVFLNAQGNLLDDSILYRVADNTYLICLNSGKGPLIANHLKRHEGTYTLSDLSGSLTKLDLQGPQAAKIAAKIVRNPDDLLHSFPPFSCKGGWAPHFTTKHDMRSQTGIPFFIARSGYTGEFGFEIFTDAGNALPLWEELIDAGEEFGLLPCGLASRDSLRTGAGLPLAGQDIGPWPFCNNPWDFALPYDAEKTGFTKKFLGSDSLFKAEPLYTYAFAGYDLRKIDPGTTRVLENNNDTKGRVLTCVTDMAIGRVDTKICSITSPDRPGNFTAKGISCGFLLTPTLHSYGDHVVLQDNHRKIDVEIVQSIRPHCSARLPLDHFL